MNRKKPVIVATLFLAVMLTAGLALAQNERLDRQWHHGPPGAAQKLAHLDQALDLSDQQEQQLLDVLQAAEAEREALHAEAMDAYQPEICALRQTTEAEILAILTPEQIATLEELKQERAGKREGRRGQRGLDCPDEDG
jgi:Spy/CpxP family protein refolding chaperone